jgi:hypothetical protein
MRPKEKKKRPRIPHTVKKTLRQLGKRKKNIKILYRLCAVK